MTTATIRLGERETAALLALADFHGPVTGTDLAARMTWRGRETARLAAHRAAGALVEARLAVATFDGPVRYEISDEGRKVARYRGDS